MAITRHEQNRIFITKLRCFTYLKHFVCLLEVKYWQKFTATERLQCAMRCVISMKKSRMRVVAEVADVALLHSILYESTCLHSVICLHACNIHACIRRDGWRWNDGTGSARWRRRDGKEYDRLASCSSVQSDKSDAIFGSNWPCLKRLRNQSVPVRWRRQRSELGDASVWRRSVRCRNVTDTVIDANAAGNDVRCGHLISPATFGLFQSQRPAAWTSRAGWSSSNFVPLWNEADIFPCHSSVFLLVVLSINQPINQSINQSIFITPNKAAEYKKIIHTQNIKSIRHT